MEVRWVAQTEAEVACAAAGTAKSILAVIAASTEVVAVNELGFALDATPSEAVLLELCRSTQAGAGTNTAVTLRAVSGQAVTAGATAAKNYTAEATVLTPIREWTIPDKGPFVVQFPLGREPESLVGDALILRATLPTGGTPVPNARAYMEFIES